MATELQKNKSVERRVPSKHQITRLKDRFLVVGIEVDAGGMAWVSLRASGRRTAYRVPVDMLMDFALKKGIED